MNIIVKSPKYMYLGLFRIHNYVKCNFRVM